MNITREDNGFLGALGIQGYDEPAARYVDDLEDRLRVTSTAAVNWSQECAELTQQLADMTRSRNFWRFIGVMYGLVLLGLLAEIWWLNN